MLKPTYAEDREYVLAHGTGSHCNANQSRGACPNCYPEWQQPKSYWRPQPPPEKREE